MNVEFVEVLDLHLNVDVVRYQMMTVTVMGINLTNVEFVEETILIVLIVMALLMVRHSMIIAELVIMTALMIVSKTVPVIGVARIMTHQQMMILSMMNVANVVV
jgi:hypothetical protein